MLSVRNLVKTYQSKKADTVVALNNVSIDFPETGLVFLLGKSGSGKSTLLNAIGGLDTFDSGEIIIKGKSSKDFSQSDFDSYRNTFIGFIFQEYNILENFSVQKNLALALELQGKKPDKAEIDRLLEQVEMTQYAKRKPNQLSGGQKQRVAIARALVKNPEIIMADEPTGALDSNTGKQVMDTLKQLSKTKLVIIVSHDREFAEIYGDRIIELKDGQIIQDTTKKEIEAQETQSGIKIIDDSIVYIKKGQEISEKDMKAIVKIINENSQKNDTFISFDKKGNDALKKGAKITDDGNKEAFMDTQAEDIKVKAYNGNSLKLIKSHLKFADSFKMGASALKNKVGKLVFTILLSFFAFTVFGIIDALSCWNRADSVAQVMDMTDQTHIAMKRYEKETLSIDDWESISYKEYMSVKEKFPNYVIKAVATRSGYSYLDPEEIRLNDFDNFTSSNNPLKYPKAVGYISVTSEELNALKFGIDGRLPQNENEICLSKFLFDAMIVATADKADDKKITSFDKFNPNNPGSEELTLYTDTLRNYNGYIDNTEFRVVGIIDDKTDLSEYYSKSDEEIEKDETIEIKLNYGFSRLIYVHQDKYNEIQMSSYSSSYNIEYAEDQMWGFGINSVHSVDSEYQSVKADREYQSNRYDWWNYAENRWYTPEEMEARKNDPEDSLNYYSEFDTYTKEEYITEYYGFLKSGVVDENGNIVLKDNEVIVRGDFKSAVGEDVYQSKINEGIKIKIYNDNQKVFKEYTVVGVKNSGENIFSEKEYNDVLKPILIRFPMMVSKINGTSEDKAFVKYLETYNDDNVKFAIQTPSTPMMDLLENVLIIMVDVFFWIAFAFAVFAALMLMNFISTSISYKKREIGVLRALGARGSDIFGIFFNESMIIAMINFVLSAIATVVTCMIINNVLLAKLPVDMILLNVSIRQVVLIFGVSVLAAFIGSFLPTFKISRKKPIDAINNR
ncbi:MAG: ATP-binding cassette domain-containing protein [Clostridia bacterium]|nr:ATP-binding cassette domain-containing protein [Clostridia bacterium]